jgi:hypothetical protein
MSRVKQWSTGSLGNVYPDHTNVGNPNTRGLDTNGVPGVEGYVMEDPVNAADDNRPLENLAQNDITLENNLSDVASEVDTGVFSGRYNEFNIEIEKQNYYKDPESNNSSDTVFITPIKVDSGSMLINGKTIRIGNQKIIAFLKNDGTYLFPDYASNSSATVIQIMDPVFVDNATGALTYCTYQPIYDTLSTSLPSNFTDYEIQITNYDSTGTLTSQTLFFNVYRDWEEIVPYKPNSVPVSAEAVDFKYDANFGQTTEGTFSDGYILNCGDVPGSVVSDVVVSKNIIVNDKLLNKNSFTSNGTTGKYPLVTDGLFFNNISYEISQSLNNTNIYIKDFCITPSNLIFFIAAAKNNYIGDYQKNIYMISVGSGSSQIQEKDLSSIEGGILSNLVKVKLLFNQYLFVMGSDGFIAYYNLLNDFNSPSSFKPIVVGTLEEIKDVTYWDDRLWIATDKTLNHTPFDSFIAFDTLGTALSLTTISVDTAITTATGGKSVLKSINKIDQAVGNYKIDSSLTHTIINSLQNPSFEIGGIGNQPLNWSLFTDASSSTFNISTGGTQQGNYKGTFSFGTNDNVAAFGQFIKSRTYSIGDKKVFSIYLEPSVARSVKISISEFSVLPTVLTDIPTDETEAQIQLLANQWNRVSVTHTLTQANTLYLRVMVKFEGTTSVINVDAAQLQDNSITDYVESYNFLFIGFEKIASENYNPPFALIDSNLKYQVKYNANQYGSVAKINDFVVCDHNDIYFVDDTSIYNLVFLNDEGDTSGVSIKNVSSSLGIDFSKNINSLSSIVYINDRLFFGGFLKNEVVKIMYNATTTDTAAHAITITAPSVVGSTDGIMNVLSDEDGNSYRFIPQYATQFGTNPPTIEFVWTDNLVELQGTTPVTGKYLPNSVYSFGLEIDGDSTQQLVLTITSPLINQGPWTMTQIVNQLNSALSELILDPTTTTNILKIAQRITIACETSSSIIDGVYSIGEKELTKYLRGNVSKMIKQAGQLVNGVQQSDSVYFVDGLNIYASQFDANILKRADGTYPIQGKDLDYFHPWQLYTQNSNVVEYNNKINQEVVFTDDSNNKFWIQLPVDNGYSLFPGSVRVKTGSTTEFGFNEDEDYFVDYTSGKIIRSTGTNLLNNSNFKNLSNGAIANWNFWTEIVDVNSAFQLTQLSQYNAEVYIQNTNHGIISQTYTPSIIAVGDTYSFSIDFWSDFTKSISIVITECTSTNYNSFVISPALSTTQTCEFTSTNIGQWERFSLSRTVEDASTTILRVEIRIDDNKFGKTYLRKAQLEKSSIATPWIETAKISKIDPNMHVWIDFVQYKKLSTVTDYTFDTINRQVIINNLNANSNYYLDYMYQKIFNPSFFPGESIPTYKLPYDSRDDYFVYFNEGRIWAINQIFSILSFDKTNPLDIAYNYHYPRVDRVKIRNTPDKFGNYAYIVKGTASSNNPYAPFDAGNDTNTYDYSVSFSDVVDSKDNDVLYDINVTSLDYNKNDIYDRRIYIDSREHKNYNISLYPETVAYFPFSKDFSSTNGLQPVNFVENSKIVPIIKNFMVVDDQEIGAYHDGYQYALRTIIEYPLSTFSIFVDPQVGNDTNNGTESFPLKTIAAAVNLCYYNNPDDRKNNIILSNTWKIQENINIDVTNSFDITIVANTYATMSGAIQSTSKLTLQGIIFDEFNIYPLANLNVYFCTFSQSYINCSIPITLNIENSDIEDGQNSFIRVNNRLFPSPFIFPYMADINAEGNLPKNITDPRIAVQDSEAIHPGDVNYNINSSSNYYGQFSIYRCLIARNSASIIDYDITTSWTSTFAFSKCTIVSNASLFTTTAHNLTVSVSDSIFYQNGTNLILFDSNSPITIRTSFIDFASTAIINSGAGAIFGLNGCIGGENVDPNFININSAQVLNYHLKSTASGYLIDSVCLNAASDNTDLGCYDQIRQREDTNIPENLRSYFAYILEGIKYQVVLNSEKITFALQFKPTVGANSSGVIFDTRADENTEDYIVLCYNNNDPSSTEIEPIAGTSESNPYRFKIIIANKLRKAVILSPIEITTDVEFQIWHNLIFTVNYEMTLNPKPTFDQQDKLQNIITFYHNNELAVESFLRLDMNRDDEGALISGFNNDKTNDWNFNNISMYITLGASFDSLHVMEGYYSELRIDNRFIDRKELSLWNQKIVPFNDPYSLVNQANLARTFDTRIINEFWPLRDKYGIGAKGNHFEPATSKNLMYQDGELTWALTNPTQNIITDSNFENENNAAITGIRPLTYPYNLSISQDITFVATGSRNVPDTDGNVKIGFNNYAGQNFASQIDLDNYLSSQFALLASQGIITYITYRFLADGRIEFYTKDLAATQLTMSFKNNGDPNDLGLTSLGSTATVSGNKKIDFTISGITSQSSLSDNIVYIEHDDTMSNIGSNSIYIEKKSSSTNVDPIIITHSINAVEADKSYYYSLYVESTDNIFNDIKFSLQIGNSNPVLTSFDSITRQFGNYWLLTKYVTFITGLNTNINIGISATSVCNFRVNGIQFEQNSFPSKFAVLPATTKSFIEINKNILREDRGIIFFKFQPLFDFTTTDERILLHITEDNGSSTALAEDMNNGFKVSYVYDPITSRGKLQFNINDLIDNNTASKSQWVTNVVASAFDNWHTCAISYDFNTNSFKFWFDTFNYTMDVNLPKNNFFSNLFIGIDNKVSAKSADILIKDIIVTNYVISDAEFIDWVTANEFYKEDVFINLLEEYKKDLESAVLGVTGVSISQQSVLSEITALQTSVTQAVAQINSFTGTVAQIDTEQVSQGDIITAIQANTTLVTNKVDNVDPNSLGLLQVQNYMQDGNTNKWTTALGAAGENLHTLTFNLNAIESSINDEISNREIADTQMYTNLASNILGEGASIVGVATTIPGAPLDAAFSNTTVEKVLRELAGSERTTETIKQNATNISILQTATTTTASTLSEIEDGNTNKWTPLLAANNGYNLYSLRTDVNINTSSISTLTASLTTETTNRTAFQTSLASTATGQGASLISISDAGGVIAATTVEEALQEIIGTGRTNQTIMSLSGLVSTNTSNISTNTTSISTINSTLGLMQDGATGSTWINQAWNLKNHEIMIENLNSEMLTAQSNITSQAATLTSLQSSLTQEISSRSLADIQIATILAANTLGAGASTIGINTGTGLFTSTTVEGALEELINKFNVFKNGLTWQGPVANLTALNAITGNVIGDTRVVESDDAGATSQYYYNGTAWIKIADINWGNASAIAYSNATSGLKSTNVQAAIDEFYSKVTLSNTHSETMLASQWITNGASGYYYDIHHNLGTTDVVCQVMDTSNGQIVQVDSFARLDINTLRVSVLTNDQALQFTVFAVQNSYSTVIGNWTPYTDGRYYCDCIHNLGTTQLQVSIFDMTSGSQIETDTVDFINVNTCRIWAADNSMNMNVFLLKKSSSTKIKDIQSWSVISSGEYSATFNLTAGYDAIYEFFDPISGQTLMMDSVSIVNDTITVLNTSNSRVRMVIMT